MRIAVIGSGISGNAAAFALSARHEVVLFEKNKRAGGHSATVDIDYDGTHIAVDTGFIVYNELNYPNLVKLFDHLGVETIASDMSFGVSIAKGQLEWSGKTLGTVFAQKANLLKPRFLGMLRDILQFNKQCVSDLAAGRLEGLSLGDYLAERRYGAGFREDYLLPMGAAIWSTPDADIMDFPAENFVRFFANHRLINSDRPIWRTVKGGSRNYVSRLLAPLKALGAVRLGAEVQSVTRESDHVMVKALGAEAERFDAVVFACHAGEALAMIANPSTAEREVLGVVRTLPNDVVLHRDVNLMPRRKAVWSSWNYLRGTGKPDSSPVAVSYWMNLLQSIDDAKPLFITLNPNEPVREDLVFGRYRYEHPQFDAAAIAAQKRLPSLQGQNRSWFCGAWTANGFHEDGLASGLAVGESMGGVVPWRLAANPPALEAAE